MGAMAKMTEEERIADEQMAEFAKNQAGQPTEEPAIDLPEIPEPIESPVEPPVIPEPKADTPMPLPDIEQLKVEVTRLQTQLNDENNPTWMQRYDTLNGMQRVLADQLKEVKGQLAELKTQKESVPSKPLVDVSAARKRLEDTYTPEMIDDILALASPETAMLNEKIRQLESNVKSYQQDIGQVKTEHKKTAEQAFLSDLTSRAPSWKKYNGWESEGIKPDPKFLLFLDKTAPGTRYTYRQLVKSYQQEGDVEMTANIFKIFETDQGTSIIPPNIDKLSAGIEKHIEPGKTVSGSPPPVDKDKTKKTYPATAVDKFFMDLNKGKFKNIYTQAELDAMSDEYTTAMSEGRVK